MKTYLPYADFDKCAECFTTKRLTKQRHDAMEILYLLSGRNHPTRGDRFMYNSPPKKVWQHCPLALCEYVLALCDEYEKRTGKPDPIRSRCESRQRWFKDRGGPMSRMTNPTFLGSESMQRSHQAILARQDEQHYAEYGFVRCPDDEKVFYWPVDEAVAQYECPQPEWVDDNDDTEDTFDDDGGCDCEACLAARDGDHD